jgi:carboxyl-terminal processing protease
VAGERTMDNALPWDTIQPVDYAKLNLVQPYLSLLRERSDARVATNQDFIYIRQDIAELQKLQADKTITLNEREALKEREKIAAQNKARDAERDTRPAPEEKVYELTVENCDQPGLPLPSGHTNVVAAAGTTNTVATAAGKKPLPAIDPKLDEVENILEDYVALLSKSNVLIANHINL